MRDPIRQRWYRMMCRCYNPKRHNYHNYGGRGISVCAEWHKFEEFKLWALENGFDPCLSIDRIDNDQGYSPSNCRWATAEQQSRNKSNTVLNEAMVANIKWFQNIDRSPPHVGCGLL